MAFRTVALRDCGILLTLASETGQESPTLYLILKMPLDPVQGLTFLIRLVNPGCAQIQAATLWDERRDCTVSDDISNIMLANREMWVIRGLSNHNL